MKPIKLFTLTLVLLASTSSLQAAPDALLTEESVIGTVGGKEIRLSDIEDQKINELRIELHGALQEAFIRHAVTTLSNSSGDYKQEAPSPVSDEQVENFYTQNNLQSRGSLEELSPMIKQYMEGMAKAQSDFNIYKLATSRGDITSRLVKPKEMLLNLAVESGFVRGNQQAKVMLMEFSDYQCPFCRRAQGTVNELMEQYGDRVAFGYRHFPLAFHTEADDAAYAVECARDQDGFEAMHEILFNETDLSRPNLKKIAEKVGLKDLAQFNSCLDKEQYAERVANDMAAAQSVGISGTPGFIVGYYDPDKGIVEGELISGAQPANVFATALEKYLQGR
ncbi:DsbA family protein [Sedimenticola thiotaurini]|uniref:DsbA family protein n=1 Tax=Sedimenticola thiotaurini TaxID=1543721 RepID=UPI00069B6801|nr:thioredoxin domain-containing protein [Sedimenticola thiotaurini]